MTDFVPVPSCADPTEAIKLSVNAARQQILRQLQPIQSWQHCALRDALGEVLDSDLQSPCSVPPHNNSAMDGYAVHSRDLQAGIQQFEQIATAYAGSPYTGPVSSGQCVRIMTGAVVPADCDSVIMQEHCQAAGQQITMHGAFQAGQNVRMAGEDIQQGDTVLPAGKRLTPADLGLIASLGLAEVRVRRRLRVAFFSTGDELQSLGQPLQAGQIYDSNRYTLFAMLQRFGADIRDMGVVADNKAALREAFLQASAEADVLITSGGVSVGDADFVKDMLAELGQVKFWKIAMKPGRPLAFGQVGPAVFFGLPGNPVSVMVTFYQFVLPALQKLSGQLSEAPLLLTATSRTAIHKRPGRFEFQRGLLSYADDGQLQVDSTGEQGSGILRSMSMANCFILLDDDCDGVTAGSKVMVQPFSGLI